MTGKERNVLDEIRGDVKKLLDFMATSNERARGCERRFKDLEDSSRWTKGKILLILGFGMGLGYSIGIIIKVL